MRSLRAALLDEPLAKLMAIADTWDAAIQATSPKEVADSLSSHILRAELLIDGVDGLPAHARDALDVLLKSAGKMPLAAFERRFGVIRAMGPGRLERERPWMSPANAAEVLWYRGFVFRAFDRAGAAPVEAVFVPSDMLPLLAAPGSAPQMPAPATPAPLRTDPALQSSPLLDDVTTLLCFVQNQEVRVRADGLWDLLSRQALARMLRDSSGVEDAHPDKRFAFLLNLLARLGWTRPQDGRLKLSPQPVGNWLQTPAPQRREVLAQAWLGDPDWNDLAHVDGIELEMTHAWANQPARERAVLTRLFAEWINERSRQIAGDASEGWPSEFAAHVKKINPDFARTDGRYDTWHIREAHSGEYLNGFENWDRVEGALIRSILSGPLRWLEDARLPREVANAAPADRLFAVAADATISIANTLAFERFQLARVADWLETQSGAFVYHLTPRSLKRASDQGIKPARVLEYLEEKAGSPPPAAVARAVERWTERASEARIEAALLLRTRDAATLDALLKLDAIRRASVERLAPTCAAIRARDQRAIRAAIAASGLLVDLSA